MKSENLFLKGNYEQIIKENMDLNDRNKSLEELKIINMNEKNDLAQKNLKETNEIKGELTNLREKLRVKVKEKQKFSREVENYKIVISEEKQKLTHEIEKNKVFYEENKNLHKIIEKLNDLSAENQNYKKVLSEEKQKLTKEIEKNRVFYEENKNLHNAIEKLNGLANENQHLKNQIENYFELLKENKILKDKIENSRILSQKNRSLKKEIDALLEKNRTLNEQVGFFENIIQKESEKLTTEIEQKQCLFLNNQKIIDQNQKMKNEIDLYQSKMNLLIEEKNDLKIEIKRLRLESDKKIGHSIDTSKEKTDEKEKLKIADLKKKNNFNKKNQETLGNGLKGKEEQKTKKIEKTNNFLENAINNFLQIQADEEDPETDNFLEEEFFKLLEQKTSIIENLKQKVDNQKNSSLLQIQKKKDRILIKNKEIADLKSQIDQLQSKLNKLKVNNQ